MTVEGAVGLVAGITAASVALVGWALSPWWRARQRHRHLALHRQSGHSETSERTAQRLVAVSFWLLAPYVAAESVRDLVIAHRPRTTTLGIALTAVSLVVMPGLGRAKHRLGALLGSASTAGEGTQTFSVRLLPLPSSSVWLPTSSSGRGGSIL